MPNSYGGGQYGTVIPTSPKLDRAFHSTDKYEYWGGIDDAYNRAFRDDNNLFINASYAPKSTASLRYQEGVAAGKNLLAKLMSGELTLDDGETIKIVGHSQGAAFAAGIASIVSKNKTYGGLLEFVDYISPHQPGDIKHPKNVKGRQFSTLSDRISSKGLLPKWITNSQNEQMEGVEQARTRGQYKGGYGGHAVDTWLNDLINYWRSSGIKVTVIE
ncbi:hypothetical protein [Pedobacter ginsengisoli]|uniref:hypothetical protein n=1 Tax=Pedobacter ginsengisoli TaxID=363852 RepID=UPI001FE4706B|nr:hypothetical protein [Pedobacter ginsengisoli]